jgi:nucleotide-binding universal stress UspA family protein
MEAVMTYKTIVAIIQNPSDISGLLEAVVPLASRLGSQLVGIHAEPLPAPMTSALGFPDAEFVITTGEINRKRSAELEAAFKKRLGEAGLPFEWSAVESFSGDSAVAARAGARTADLVVASEAHSDDIGPGADLDSLLYETGRPVLLVPLSGLSEGPFRKVLVAWNGTAEAARAAFDALPFIMEADETSIVTIDAGDNPEKSGTRLAAALARHGAHVSVNELSSAGRPIADVLAAHVDQSGADLLVMGAYGHSRLREFLFGGVTRSVLRAMPVATFMSR